MTFSSQSWQTQCKLRQGEKDGYFEGILGCHDEESFKTTQPSVSKLSSRMKCGDLGFCHYERSEVIQKTSAACKQIASVTTFLRNDKNRVVRRLPRRAFCTARNDKRLVASVERFFFDKKVYFYSVFKTYSQSYDNFFRL